MITPATHAPPPPPSDTTTTPLTDCNVDPYLDTCDTSISHSDSIEHPLVESVVLSPSATNVVVLIESFVTPPFDIADTIMQLPPPTSTKMASDNVPQMTNTLASINNTAPIADA